MVFKIRRRACREKSFPYHPNFGVTKEEYEFVLNAIDQSKLVNIKDGKLKFKKKVIMK